MKSLLRCLCMLVFICVGQLRAAGSLTVTLSPSAAVSAGAQWRIDGGGWQHSGATKSVSAGSHTVDFKPVTGWLTPAATTVTITNNTTTTLTATYVQPAALKITLTPTSGQWRIDGGTWLVSGATATGLTPGNHTVDYASVAGYASPSVETVTLVTNQTTTLARSYIQLSQLKITLTPTSGQWRVDGGAWQTSDAMASNLLPGSHTVDYNVVAGYVTPASESVTLTSGQSTTLTRSYVQLASITVTLTPSGSMWRVDGGTIVNGGVTIANLTPGSHVIDYFAPSGWAAPPSETVTLTAGQALTLSRSATQLAQLTVSYPTNAGYWRMNGGTWNSPTSGAIDIFPGTYTIEYSALAGWNAPPTTTITATGGQSLVLNPAFVQLGGITVTLTPSSAQWNIDGNAWQPSGNSWSGLTPGTHTVSYNSVSGYLTPAPETVTIVSGQTLTVTRTYTQAAQVTVTLTPASGTQWRVDGGAWQNSGATIANLAPGSHSLDYASLAGYTAPSAESVSLSAGQSLSLTRAYIQLAQLTVTLTPSNGQWRVDGGAWQASGATVANLTPGNHAVDYSGLTNYASPSAETVALTAGQSLALSRSYIQLAQILIGLAPSSGQWRVNGGAWQASGTSLFVPPGDYTVDYSALSLYDSPSAETITLAAGGVFATTRYYVSQKPTLRINLTPATGQWRIDGGAWQASGTQLTELDAGSHTIDYTDIGGNYAPLASETVSLALRDQITLARSYSLKPASVTITLLPTSAQWRIDGGAWLASDATAANLAPGTHAIDYATFSGYLAPSADSVTLAAGQALTLTRSYTQLAQLTVTLTPSSAQWRVDGGAWQASAATVVDLATGAHTIDYQAVAGYVTPTSESVSLPGGSTAIARSYAALASLNVTLAPNSAQWRIDGGAWQNTSTTLNNLPLGSHTIDYSDISGYLTPAPESITLVSGPNSLSRSYAALASLNIVLTPTTGQWRIDGGLWQPTSTTLNDLPLGSHTIDYSTVSGYTAPASETIMLVSGTNTLTRTYAVEEPAFAIVKRFTDVGYTPYVIRASDGVLYGVTMSEGGYQAGAMFKVNTDGTGFTPMRSFPAFTGDGHTPAALTEASDGFLYGAANNGGTANTGAIFRVSKDGATYSVVRSFVVSAEGLRPNTLREASDGFLYGATISGGQNNRGVIFKMAKDGSGYVVLLSIPATMDGRLVSALVEGADGALYGVIGASGAGIIHKLNKDGSGYTTLKTFTGADGSNPRGALLRASDGFFYGTTGGGGAGTKGTVFRLNADGSGHTVIKAFAADSSEGISPAADLGEDSAGALYGTTTSGGSGLRGTVYKLNKDGSGFTVLKAFANTPAEGGNVQFCPTIVSGGAIYSAGVRGGGANRGVLFRLGTDGSGFAALVHLGAPGGSMVMTGLAEGASGVLYGTTFLGGATDEGTLFKVNKDGTGHTVIYSFNGGGNVGSNPSQSAIAGSDGALYGVYGSQAYRVNVDGTGFTVLHTFAGGNDGSGPQGVIEGSDGLLYGATGSGGTSNFGTVFKMAKDGTGYAILKNFAGGTTDAQWPYCTVTEGHDGVLYGTSYAGGSAGLGTVFRLAKNGTNYAVLKQFTGGTGDGAQPWSGVMHGSDGFLYGVTYVGGTANFGTIYKVATDGTGYTVLHSFTGAPADGSSPAYGSVTESNGVLYGTASAGGTLGGGTLYSIQHDGSGYSTLINFGAGATDGHAPDGVLIHGNDGRLYGTTAYGGNGAVIFRFRTN